MSRKNELHPHRITNDLYQECTMQRLGFRLRAHSPSAQGYGPHINWYFTVQAAADRPRNESLLMFYFQQAWRWQVTML